MATAAPPLQVVAADGVWLELADGRRLIDGISSWWTACHGHNHPFIRAAIAKQLETLPHVMFAGLSHAPAEALAERLVGLLPRDAKRTPARVFFAESGSVAVEIALKIAIQYWRNRGQRRTRFLAFRGGYHGDTLGALSVSDPACGFHDACADYRQPHFFADLPRTPSQEEALARLLAEHGGEIAAAIVEPRVQGAGGMRFHEAETLAALRRLCDEHDVLLIADEIMTGFGRTGRLFACESAGIAADVVCLSKALTSGTLPLSAVVASEAVYAAFHSPRAEDALMHGPTFMANPLACAAANASLELFAREPRLVQVAAIEAQMARELAPCRDLPGVAEVRVMGALGVVQLTRPVAASLRPAFVARGLWLRPFADIVYLAPPFVIAPSELSRLCAGVCEVVAAWSQSPAADACPPSTP